MITAPEDQVTPDIMSKFEFCLLMGKRAKMIEESNDCYADLNKVPRSLQGSLNVE